MKLFLIEMAKNECEKYKINNTNMNAIISPCLSHAGNVFRRFIQGLKYFDITDFDDVIINKKYIVVYHGTSSLNNVKSICHNGWDVSLRSYQKFGKGEYFSENIDIAQYFGSQGAVIGSIIIEPALVSKQYDYEKVEYSKYIRVCENTKKLLFVFPLYIIQTHGDVSNCVCDLDKI
jgi:hypothetical protein